MTPIPCSTINSASLIPLRRNSLDPLCKLCCLWREVRCRDEHALGCFLPGKRAVKRLNFRASNDTLPPLSLNVYLFQAETVQGNDAIYSCVAGAANPCQILFTSAVPNFVKNVEDNILKMFRRDFRKRFNKLCGDALSQFGERLLKPVIRAHFSCIRWSWSSKGGGHRFLRVRCRTKTDVSVLGSKLFHRFRR